ncbi:MAG: DedA family protein [Candidatus Gottesmanbacteria bacterium]|nr:DedA family protein [Candidatus Gottesmanbacteria bacterium]
MIELIGSWIIHFISTLGYFGVFILMALESACIPIPSEVTMPFAGSLVVLGTFNFWLVVLVGTLGNLVGSLLAYWLGWWGQETVVRKIIVKYGKYILISESEYDRSERWFRNHGELIVLLSRVLPVLRTFISLPAGVAKMKFKKFVVYTVVGCLIWSYILTQIGVVLGNNWKSLEGIFRKFDVVIVVAGVLVVVWYVWHKLKHFRKHKAS